MPGEGGALGPECRGRGQDGKDRVLSKRAGPWALACFAFKIRDGDRQRNDLETQGETTRDRRQTHRQREKPRQVEPPPTTHTQGEAGRGSQGEPRRRGSREAARPLPHSDQKGSPARSLGELGGSHQPVSPCPPTWLRPGDSPRRGGPPGCLAWPGCPSLSRWGPKEPRCPPRQGQAPTIGL